MQGKVEDLVKYLFTLDRDKEYEIKEVSHKRSLDSNAYAWKLINEIGNVVNKSKEEVYINMLKHYGQVQMVSVLSSVDMNGYFKYFEEVGTSVLNRKEFKHYKIFKGSSEFNQKEMSILIDGIVQEATQLGIKTLDDIKIEEMIRSWNK